MQLHTASPKPASAATPSAVFFNVPGHGHINPSLPLVAKLTRRGHRITYFATEGFRAAIEASGAIFCAYSGIDDHLFDKMGGGRSPQRTAQALIEATSAMLPSLLEKARAAAPDYILFDGMCPWGWFIARSIRVPAVASLALTPLTKPPISALPKMLPAILPMVLRDLRAGISAINNAKALTHQYGLPAIAAGGILNAVGDLSISYTSAELVPFANTVDRSVRFVGWTPHDPVSPENFALPEGRVIYISLGTINNANVAFFKACIDAFADDARHSIILSTGGRIPGDTFGALPANVKVYEWVPQVAVLQRASLFVSHGGMGSVHDSLTLGVPLLLAPQQGEQHLTAMRVVELGAGLILKLPSDAMTIRAKASQILQDPAFSLAAEHLGSGLRAAGGAPRAADEIESLLRRYPR